MSFADCSFGLLRWTQGSLRARNPVPKPVRPEPFDKLRTGPVAWCCIALREAGRNLVFNPFMLSSVEV